jgi:hypothetical protein
MLEHLFRCPRVRRRLQTHFFADFLSHCAAHLHPQGYAITTIRDSVRYRASEKLYQFLEDL